MTPDLLIATSNEGKFQEFKRLLGNRFESIKATYEITVVEDGETYYENALKKAMAFQREFARPVLADDSGLEVKVLGNQPGVHTARFGGEGLSWPERWNHLYEAINGYPPEQWEATFRCVLCYYDGRRVPYFFEGRSEGRIAPAPRGERGFGYDPVFIPYPLRTTFAEATDEEKERLSHRGEAAREFLAWAAKFRAY